jgi:hypothetical protein
VTDGQLGTYNDMHVNKTVKHSKDLHMPLNDKWVETILKLDKYIGEGVKMYLENIIASNSQNSKIKTILQGKFGSNIDNTSFQIQKYEVGGKFEWHMDDAFGCKRLIAFIVYLNNVSENDGGCTKFADGRKIIPKMGNILFFPSTWTYPHTGEQVKNGTKYIVTGFIRESII